MGIRRFACLVVAWLLVAWAPARADAPATSTVVAGKARFEFLTPSLVRLEYEPSGHFVDAPTAVVQQRDWPAVAVRRTQQGGWLVAGTGAMTLRYKPGSGPFMATNLEVTWRGPDGRESHWHPGDVDKKNLGGLTYSLDDLRGTNLPAHGDGTESPVGIVIPGIEVHLQPARPGLLSRSGWVYVDDSRTPLWNPRTRWIEPRPTAGGQDGYLFTYGHDYARVLRDYARLCGAIPMVPRYVFGPWITDFNFEYFPGTAQAASPQFRAYNQQALQHEVSRLRDSGIPFDTLVLDFAWHNYGWDGGYDWSPLIPHPDAFIDWLHARGIRLALNDHPGYANTRESILSFDDSHAPQVLKDLGRPLPARPAFDLEISRHWRFAPDPHGLGLDQHWFAPGFDDGGWKPVRTDLSWQEQGWSGDQGLGWYRTSLHLPAQLPAHLYLYFGEVAQDYRLFVNGIEVPHSHVQWPRRLTTADVARYVRAGQSNVFALRVQSGKRGGGILRGPVALRDVPPPGRIAFDLSDKAQAEVFMRDLHLPLMRQGADLWWVDGGSGAAGMPGLDPQLWTNKVFYDYARQASGERAFILGRYGDWGSERYPGYFTGDTWSEWPVLAYEVAYAARAGNVAVPYVSHDIGGFHGGKIDFDLYARWIEFGTFSPILRMHSAHANPLEGNLRMPWVYGAEGVALMRKYFTLREQLVPYLYTQAWLAHRDTLPILRPLYLAYPDTDEAYRHPHEYFFGKSMLVAPVLAPDGEVTVWLPPGSWIDFFTGKRYAGGRSFSARYAVDQIPVFVREGAIVPEQALATGAGANPGTPLVLNVYGAGQDRFELYEDDGHSLAYEQGAYALTPMAHVSGHDGRQQLLIGPTHGRFADQPPARVYELHLHVASRPQSISVDGKPMAGWRWDARHATAVVRLPRRDIREAVTVRW
ncbi:MAG TPA: TIM-barrel domain-containing protein [Frateuria sp.]|uniref:glycoside hydrolase family 31 protein n=1 Tax=Frateuria sp. TaxID=2211372 RepID=UPI002D7E26AC|nr:TIM-barrel domain-containing protein [Frateuria sp.]HET6803844.1 TIM-barrel domain-containing protein [Frateuria sp.]